MNQNTISDRSMNDAAAYLRKRRHELKLTQPAVADKAEIKLQQYQKFESGERSILTTSFFITCKVLDAMGIDIQGFHRDYIGPEKMMHRAIPKNRQGSTGDAERGESSQSVMAQRRKS